MDLGARVQAWLSEQAAQSQRWIGEVVLSWAGVEMAIREESATGAPEFISPEVPCVQLRYLLARTASGRRLVVDTVQADIGFSLHFSGDDSMLEPWRWTGIYRLRELTELRTGRIDSIVLGQDEAVHDEALITIGGGELLLVAAEIHECVDAALGWHRFDESVLAFADPADADTIDWLPPRPAGTGRLRSLDNRH